MMGVCASEISELAESVMGYQCVCVFFFKQKTAYEILA